MPLRLLLILFVLLLPCYSMADDRSIKRKPVTTEGRTALVIGNASYIDAPLANPVHDAEDMAVALKKSGFKVDLHLNSSQRQMESAIQDLGDRLRQGGVGLFYFAGHGIQVKGVNYLIPVNANIKTEADVRYEAVNAGRALSQMQEAGNRLNMVFLDACRNNPYARSFRSADSGLAAMDAPSGSLVSFATAPGSVAADGAGRNGIYTKHLLRQMKVKDLELGRMMKQVRRGVQTDTGKQQMPFELSSLIGDFYFIGGSDADATATAATTVVASVDNGADAMWLAVENTNEPEELRLFLAEYPDSRHRGVAKLRLSRLERKEVEPEPETGRLFVTAIPDDARIRILNIKPRYRRGMQLATGSYHIEIVKTGYTTNRKWIELAAGEEVKLDVILDEIVLVKPTVVTAPSRLSSGPSEVRREGRFIAYSNGTVKDSKTGLMWAAENSSYDVDWDGAKRYCKNFTGGGYTDWRMPTSDELFELYADGIRKDDKQGRYIISVYLYIWSAETRSSSAAVVVFTDGNQLWNIQSNSAYSRALPVRGGN